MRTFFKTVAMGAVVVGGSLLALWLAFTGHHALAGLALAGMVVLAVVVIVYIARDTKSAPIKGTSGSADDAMASGRAVARDA